MKIKIYYLNPGKELWKLDEAKEKFYYKARKLNSIFCQKIKKNFQWSP